MSNQQRQQQRKLKKLQKITLKNHILFSFSQADACRSGDGALEFSWNWGVMVDKADIAKAKIKE